MSDVPELRELKRLRVAELRALLESRNLDSSGTKDALVSRLDGCRGSGEVAPEDEDAPPPKKTKPAAPDAPSPASPSPPPPDARADPPPASSPAARLYVGFLGDTCDRDFVARLFAPHFTPARIHVPTSRRGDAIVPRGFAFVDAPADAPPDAVASAVAALRDSVICPGAPRALVVAPARAPLFDGSHPATVHLHTSTAKSSSSARVDSNPGRRLVVDGLPPDVTEETATRAFRAHGSVRSVRIFDPREGEENEPRRAAVEFETEDAAEAAARALADATPFFGGGPLRVSRNGESGARDRDRNRNRDRNRGRGRGGGRGSGRDDKGRERGRGRGDGNARGGGGGVGGGGIGGGYVGVHLAGLPPSASVSSEYAHLYRR